MADASAILKQAYPEDDEESSQEWDRIKNFVGSAEPKKKHPISQMMEREQRKVPGFSEGGDAGDPNADLRLLEPPGAGILAPSAAPPPPEPPPVAPKPPISGPAASMPPAAPVAPPAPIAPPTDAAYESEAAKTLGTSPEELKAFLTKTMTPTLGEKVGRSGAAIADALSRAGRGNSNYLEQFNAQTQKEKENLAAIPEKVGAAGKEQYALTHELQSYDPNSPFSKVTQNAYRGLLKTMGATDAQVSSMPANAINDVVTHQVELKKALAEIEATGTYRSGMLGLQAEAEKTRQEEAKTRKEEAEKGALEEVTKGSKVPFLGPSHAQKQAAFEKLGNLGGLGPKDFATVEAAEAANLPKGTKVTINGRSATIQ